MLRTILLSTAVAVTFAALPAAAQQRTVTHPSYFSSFLPSRATRDAPQWKESPQLAAQVQRWGAVGRCVATADRATSLAFVNAKRGSDAFDAAARKLDPLFDQCAQGVRLKSRDDQMLRRAAVADALR